MELLESLEKILRTKKFELKEKKEPVGAFKKISMSSPRRPPPPPPAVSSPAPPAASSPEQTNIEDKYYYGLTPDATAKATSGSSKLAPKEPPAQVLNQGPEAVSSWYKAEAARLHQHANLSQQRNQMLVQTVLEMRRELAVGGRTSSSKGDTKTGTTSTTTKSGSEALSSSSTTTTTTSTTASSTISPSLTASPSSSSRLMVRELDASPMSSSSSSNPHRTATMQDRGGGNDNGIHNDYNDEEEGKGNLDDLAWTELKLQRSHHNFHALSKRTREVETSNAKAGQMIVDLRHEVEVARVRSEEADRREKEGRNLVTQLSNHVESLKRQQIASEKKMELAALEKKESEDKATRWRKERREIGGYALRLEKDAETLHSEIQKCTHRNQSLVSELDETKGTLRETLGKMRAQAETQRIQQQQSVHVLETDSLHRSVESGVLALRSQIDQSNTTMQQSLTNGMIDLRNRLDETTNQLQEAHTRNEVLTVRTNNAVRSAEEYREKAKKLQGFLTSGSVAREDEMAIALSKIATLENQLGTSIRDKERCRNELTSVLTAMETARDRLLQSSEARETSERNCEQMRQQVKDAESRARTLQTRLEVLNEDCLASKKQIGALEAETIHLEQQVRGLLDFLIM